MALVLLWKFSSWITALRKSRSTDHGAPVGCFYLIFLTATRQCVSNSGRTRRTCHGNVSVCWGGHVVMWVGGSSRAWGEFCRVWWMWRRWWAPSHENLCPTVFSCPAGVSAIWNRKPPPLPLSYNYVTLHLIEGSKTKTPCGSVFCGEENVMLHPLDGCNFTCLAR